MFMAIVDQYRSWAVSMLYDYFKVTPVDDTLEAQKVLAVACDVWVKCHSTPHTSVKDFQDELRLKLEETLVLTNKPGPTLDLALKNALIVAVKALFTRGVEFVIGGAESVIHVITPPSIEGIPDFSASDPWNSSNPETPFTRFLDLLALAITNILTAFAFVSSISSDIFAAVHRLLVRASLLLVYAADSGIYVIRSITDLFCKGGGHCQENLEDIIFVASNRLTKMFHLAKEWLQSIITRLISLWWLVFETLRQMRNINWWYTESNIPVIVKYP